jgi:hypothetical protein
MNYLAVKKFAKKCLSIMHDLPHKFHTLPFASTVKRTTWSAFDANYVVLPGRVMVTSGYAVIPTP